MNHKKMLAYLLLFALVSIHTQIVAHTPFYQYRSPRLNELLSRNKQAKGITPPQTLTSWTVKGTKLIAPPPIAMTTAQIMGNAHIATHQCQSTKPLLDSKSVQKAQAVAPFTVAAYSETGQYGPSADAGVGTTQVTLGSKGRIRTMLKATGQIDNVLNISYDRFFSAINLGTFTADPNIIYDSRSQRWFLFCNASPFLLLAMSDGADNGNITSQTVWSFFIIDSVLTPQGKPNPTFDAVLGEFDYPTLGLDQNNVYCATNVYDLTNPAYTSSAVYAIPKSSLFAGGKLTIYSFRNLINQQTMNGPFTPQPALNFDTNPLAGYFVSLNQSNVAANNMQQLLLSTLTITSGAATLSTQSIAVNQFVSPIFDPGTRIPKSAY